MSGSLIRLLMLTFYIGGGAVAGAVRTMEKFPFLSAPVALAAVVGAFIGFIVYALLVRVPRWIRVKLACRRDVHLFAGCTAKKTHCPECGDEGVVAETLCCRTKEKFVHVRWVDVPACPDNSEFCTPGLGEATRL